MRAIGIRPTLVLGNDRVKFYGRSFGVSLRPSLVLKGHKSQALPATLNSKHQFADSEFLPPIKGI